MLSSPRRPSSTMRIFSSAEWCRRVARRISRTVFSALSGMRLLACLIVATKQGYDEPGIVSYAIRPFCPTSADGLQSVLRPLAQLSGSLHGPRNDWPAPERQRPFEHQILKAPARASGDRKIKGVMDG